ncbi:hypothetical protein [Bilophila wadsworthia]|uniref:hypothetical protein n=1 Tax=Bilophila wadsworthia TaxID=35833 RepID=UPI003AB68ED9
MARPKPLRIIVWVVLITLALIGMMGAIIYAERENIANFLNGVNQEEVQEDPQVIIEEPVTTIQDILDMREQMREDRRVDSVFLAMPKVVLIDILMQHGTSLSIKDMTYIYESNTSTYNTVLSGARAQKYLDDSIQTHVISTVVNDSIQN